MTDEVLFSEPGGQWRVVAYGPIFCLVVLTAELFTGPLVHWFALLLAAVLTAGLVALQVVAARTHVSVELTRTTLRDGTEELALADIAEVLPPADPDEYELEKWETARALGELANVPRRRTAIGLRLRGGGLVRAWARDSAELRRQLDALVPVREAGA
ncbi:hypothetical protein G4H71_15670 [Rhodococcus triatomae]|uniref:DUF3093 domain-containing protein n=1 Tax=Rhodococcus triatomae TaxID=300028 RepID=A0A1G8J6M7_9NOCA|nr:hypothetical protein [Rhodococcus triatomae]QNG19802.1 hypothetical protein G4H72_14700 [Rhodococcus triatomae]QNG24282.1 hypothetical protein G4H71_15670 [Rhodococcus triatomae]SDI26761.1 hypothetical protein SAMN05444695_10683 [Rhodococcus triatomae]